MAVQIRRLLEQIVHERSKGEIMIANTTKTKLFLKGIDFNKYGPRNEKATSPCIQEFVEFVN